MIIKRALLMNINKKIRLGLAILFISLLLSACGPSPEELAATSAAETAAAATNTPIPTSTPKATQTPTPTPTITPKPSLSKGEKAYADTVINLIDTYRSEWGNVVSLLLAYSDDPSLSYSGNWLDQLAASLNLIHEANQSIDQLSVPNRFKDVQDQLINVSSDSTGAILMLAGLVPDRLNQTIIMPGWTKDMIWYSAAFIESGQLGMDTAQENLEKIMQEYK
jgi:hypothetical protein